MFGVRRLVIENRDAAEQAMRRIGADQGGIALMVDKALSEVIEIQRVSSPAANILKQEMLSVGGDAAVARGVVTCQVDKSSVLLLGNRKQLKALVQKIWNGPFGLGQIAVGLKEYMAREEQPPYFQMDFRGRTLQLGARTHIMGVLNVTPDSFSDGGEFLQREKAVEQAERMVAQGADIIDVGGESSRPGAEPVSTQQEIERIIPVIEELAPRLTVPISVDTYKAEVASRALEAGASAINDISALRFDPQMADVVARHDVPLVLMHMLGNPRTMQDNPSYTDLMGEIYTFLSDRIETAVAAGIKRNKIILDPGIGFGKTVEHNLEIIRRLKEFHSLGRPILIGPSRKSFIGKVLGLPVEERLEGTAAAVAIGIVNGANIVRVHDVGQMVRVTRMADSFKPNGAFQDRIPASQGG